MTNTIESLFHSFFEITGATFVVILLLNTVLNNFSPKNKLSTANTGAVLGFIPGCSGAISASLMYANSRITFGVLVAAMLTTMGDGAFLLLSTRPKSFLLISLISFVTAIIVGTIITKLNIKIQKDEKEKEIIPIKVKYSKKHIFNKFNNYVWKIFIVLIPLISIMSIGHTTGLIPEAQVHSPWFMIVSFITLILMMFNSLVINKLKTCKRSCTITCKKVHGKYFILKKTFDQTSNIIILLFMVLIPITIITQQIDLASILLAQKNIILLIFIVSLISLIPGSTPQILMVSLFLQSKIPFTLLLASSIATSGDATFILFRSRKKAVIIAAMINFTLAVIISIAYMYINRL